MILIAIGAYFVIMMIVGTFGHYLYQDYILKRPDSKFGPLFGSAWRVHFTIILCSGLILPWLLYHTIKKGISNAKK